MENLTQEQSKAGMCVPIHLTLPLSASQRDILISERAGASPAVPTLSLGAPYRRSDGEDVKEVFRAQLLDRLRQHWTRPSTENHFKRLAELLGSDGCVMFGGLLDASRFKHLISRYTETLCGGGSETILHSYVNLANHSNFLTDNQFNDAFLHPLLIALIAYRMGGSVRMTDARGKDTQPMSVLAQDNILHIDNTPFREEYKIILAWQKGAVRGPAGQNFTYLPGTHHGSRSVAIDASGEAWSTENASIFTSDAAIEGLFAFQQATGRPPTVVEAQYPEQPLTITFAAGALVHHRYRTAQGNARSCMIMAFHRVSDDPGALVTRESGPIPSLAELLIGPQNTASVDVFLDVLGACGGAIADKLQELEKPECAPTLVDPQDLALSGSALSNWRAAATTAPSVHDIKTDSGVRLSTEPGVAVPTVNMMFTGLCRVMSYDKHGLLDPILYADGREEVRKWARNRLREMSPNEIERRMSDWLECLVQPTIEHLLTPTALRAAADALGRLGMVHAMASADPTGASAAPSKALLSIRQFAIDLGEAIVRCETPQIFVSTSLFLFWSADDMARHLPPSVAGEARYLGVAFLHNYIASAILVEETVSHEG